MSFCIVTWPHIMLLTLALKEFSHKLWIQNRLKSRSGFLLRAHGMCEDYVASHEQAILDLPSDKRTISSQFAPETTRITPRLGKEENFGCKWDHWEDGDGWGMKWSGMRCCGVIMWEVYRWYEGNWGNLFLKRCWRTKRGGKVRQKSIEKIGKN